MKLIGEKKDSAVQGNNMARFMHKKIEKALGLEEGVVELTFPQFFEHGDFMTNVSLTLAKKENKNPKELAEQFKETLEKAKLPGIEKIEVAGPGFINFFLKKEFLAESIDTIDEKFGTNDVLSGKKIMVEYTDPNPFKEFHIGHLMTNTIGESIARLFAANGGEVKKVCYQGDKGLHVAKAVWAMKKKEEAEFKTLSDFGAAYAEGNRAYEENDEAKKEIIEINKEIYTGVNEEINALYEKGRTLSFQLFEELYKKLGTKFDYYFFESETADIGKQKVEEGLAKGIFEVGERGAIVYPESRSGIHTRVFINSEGIPTYEAKELGLAFAKRESVPVRPNAWSSATEYIKYDFDKTISITGNEINDYFRVVLSALREIDPDLASKIKHISHGMLRLPSGKMSSRTGDVVTAESLIEEAKAKILEKMGDRDIPSKEVAAEIIAIGAIKFSILRQAPGKDIIFDFDKSLSFEGDSGPYLQYTVVRARSVLEKAKEAGVKVETKGGEREAGEVERMLIRFPKIVERAQEEYSPQYVVTYLLELASLFNSYYAENRIVDADDSAPYRVALTKAVAITIENGLDLLGIGVPSKM